VLSLRPRPSSTPVLVLAGGMLASTIVLVLEARRMYFFGDEWAFLLGRDISLDGLLRPHNEHWSTLPVLVYRVLFDVVGIDHHLVYAAAPILLHVAICILLFRLLLENDVEPWPAVIAVLTLSFLSGNLGENPLWGFQIGFLGSAVFGLVALLIHSARPDASVGLALGWIATVLAFMCSGMAIAMLLWLGAYVLITRGLVRALTATVPPALVYALWYVTYGREAETQAPSASADEVLGFAWTGIGGVWQHVVRLPATGGTFFLVLLAVAMFAPLLPRTRALSLSGVLATAALYLILGTSRAGLGPEAATAGRYAYFGVLFTAPAFAGALGLLSSRLSERPRERFVAATVLTVLLCVNGVVQLRTFADGRVALDPGLKGRVLAAEQLIAENQPLLGSSVSVAYNPDITVAALSRPGVRDALPDDPVSRRDLLNASAALQVGAGTATLGLPAAIGFRRHSLAGETGASGCSPLRAGRRAFIELPPTSTGSEAELVSRASSYTVELVDGPLVSDAVVLEATPGSATFVGTTSSTGSLRIELPVGRVELCLP
jgi:hypothetical protein